MKIILTADWHAGFRNKKEEILWAMDIVFEYAKEHNITQLIGLGDLYTDRSSIDIDTMCYCYDYFKKAKDHGQNWIWFAGNHDMFLKHSWAINSLKPMSSVMTVIDGVKIIEIDGVRFWIVPFIHFEQAYMNVIHEIEKQYQDGDVLLTHIGVRTAVQNACFMLKNWGLVDFEHSPFRHIYTGHFHVPQQVNDNLWYTGSPVPFKSDEGDCEHGFIVFDTKTMTHHFENIWDLGRKYFPDVIPAPNYLTINEKKIQHLKRSDVENNIVRVRCSREFNDGEKIKFSESLYDLNARKVIIINPRQNEEIRSAANELKIGSTVDYFEEWLKIDEVNIGKKSLTQSLLRSLNSDITRSGDEKYIAERSDVGEE